MIDRTPIEALGPAILRTLAYADVFDAPLRIADITRYLERYRARADEVEAALSGDAAVAAAVSVREDVVCLRGRERLFDLRRSRVRRSAAVWPRASRYGRWIGRLPFVRMVAVTGSLAVDNLVDRADIDYLVVTEPGALWSVRAHVIALVRAVAPLGDRICPNYFLSERALELADRTLFTAHEVAQMVPVHGAEVYRRFRSANAWTSAFLPNADGPPGAPAQGGAGGPLQRVGEWAGRSRLGRRFEEWERTRKIRQLELEAGGAEEVRFTADECKGHMDGHGRHCLAAYEARLAQLGLP